MITVKSFPKLFRENHFGKNFEPPSSIDCFEILEAPRPARGARRCKPRRVMQALFWFFLVPVFREAVRQTYPFTRDDFAYRFRTGAETRPLGSDQEPRAKGFSRDGRLPRATSHVDAQWEIGLPSLRPTPRGIFRNFE